jgi:hypothetical protein
MLKIVIDVELRAKLRGGLMKATFVDEGGAPLGHYLPDDLYQSILDALAPASADDRSEAAVDYELGNHVSTAEILASIQESGHRWAGQS